MKHLIGSTLGAIVVFVVIRYLSLLILYTSDISEPILFTLFPSYWPSAIGACLLTLAESLALLLILRLIIAGTSGTARGRFFGILLAFVVVFFFYLLGNLSLLYYSYFKVFPDSSLLALTFSEEESVLYAAEPFLLKAIAITLVLSVIQSALVTLMAYLQHEGSITLKNVLISGIAFTLLCYIALSGFIYPFQRSARFPFLHHTFPEYAFLADLLNSPEHLAPEKFLEVLPSPPQVTTASYSGPKPSHIVLIILECVRPDYMPLYNSSRSREMPLLAVTAENWLRFEPLYAHGPDSETSIPVLMTSQYRAALRRLPTSGYTESWIRLRQHGVRTGFFSAGSLTWAGLGGRLGLTQVDRAVGRGDLTEVQKRDPDSAVVELWREFLDEHVTATTFSTIHFVGTHFPYSGDVESVLQPPSSIEELIQAYSGSLGKVDKRIQAVIEELRRRSLLDRSIIMVTSDHGEGLGEHGALFHGTSVFEEIVRVPLLIRVGTALSPLRSKLEQQASQVRGHVDIIPTIFDLLAVGAPPSIQGESLLVAKRRSFEVITGAKFFALTNGQSKLAVDLRHGTMTHYDLQRDPEELQPNESRAIASVCSYIAEAARVGWTLKGCSDEEGGSDFENRSR